MALLNSIKKKRLEKIQIKVKVFRSTLDIHKKINLALEPKNSRCNKHHFLFF